MAEYRRPWSTMSAIMARGIVNDIPSVATNGVVQTTERALFHQVVYVISFLLSFGDCHRGRHGN